MNEQISDRVQKIVRVLHDIATRETTTYHERENAAERLARLLEQYGITIADIDTNVKRECKYFIFPQHHELFFAIVWEVVAKWDGVYHYRKANKSYAKYDNDWQYEYIWLQLTIAEELELTAKFNHYVRDYDRQFTDFRNNIKKQKQYFAKSYVYKQGIDTHPDTDVSNAKPSDLTLKDLMAILSAADNIKQHKFAKQLAETNEQ